MIWEPRACAFCEDAFTPHNGKHKFCSADCRARHHRDVAYQRRRAEMAGWPADHDGRKRKRRGLVSP